MARGDEIVVQPGVQRARIERIVTFDGDLERAGEGQAVTLCFDRELDASRGDVIADALRPAPVADQFTCHLLWMGDNALLPNRAYRLKIGTRTVNARVMSIKHKVDVNNQAKLAARHLEFNEVGYCTVGLDDAIAFEAYATNRTLGGFILIDRQSNATVACGMLDFALGRSSNVHWQHVDIDKRVRGTSKGQQPLVPVVHRPVRRGQVHHREPGRTQAARAGLPHLPAGRRQRAPRHQQGPGFHPGRSRGEHPPHRRGGAPDGRRGLDRAGQRDLAVPQRATLGTRVVRRRRVPGSVRRRAAGRVRAARPEGPLPQGARRRDPQFHRHRRAVRASRGAGRPSAQRRPSRRRAGRAAYGAIAGGCGQRRRRRLTDHSSESPRVLLPRCGGSEWLKRLSVQGVIMVSLPRAAGEGAEGGRGLLFLRGTCKSPSPTGGRWRVATDEGACEA